MIKPAFQFRKPNIYLYLCKKKNSQLSPGYCNHCRSRQNLIHGLKPHLKLFRSSNGSEQGLTRPDMGKWCVKQRNLLRLQLVLHGQSECVSGLSFCSYSFHVTYIENKAWESKYPRPPLPKNLHPGTKIKHNLTRVQRMHLQFGGVLEVPWKVGELLCDDPEKCSWGRDAGFRFASTVIA